MSIRHIVAAACFAFVPALLQAQPAPLAPTPPDQPPPAAQALPRRTELPRGTPAPETPMPPEARLLLREGQPLNVKVDLTLTDQHGGAAPVKKTVSVVVADSLTGFIRSQSELNLPGGPVPLNVDAQPRILADGKVRLQINVQYDLPAPPDALKDTPRGTAYRTTVHENLSLILESGKPMIAAQSADPLTDRQVIVEVKATVMR